MKYKAFRDLVLVRKAELKSNSGLILPGNAIRFIRLEVLDVGPDVKESLNMGDIVLAEDMYEKLDQETGLIVSKYIIVKENGKQSN